MIHRKLLGKLLAALAFVGALALPGIATAAPADAIVTTDLNIRTGPGAGYDRFATIPAGSSVVVIGCLSGYGWCDVGWAGTRGWVSGSYLAYLGREYYRRPIDSIGPVIGLPIISFTYGDYYDRYYRGRHFRGHHFDRYRPARHDRHFDRRNDRREVLRERERRQELRQRERRQDIREERRERRQEVRRDRREHDRNVREQRRERRPEARQNRQERRDARQQRERQQRAAPNRNYSAHPETGG